MGDRGNVIIREKSKPDIFLYSHWGGSELPGDVKRALAKKWRWDDKAYLTRIIFEEMVPKEQHGDETGFGIDTQQCDNEHAYVVVDVTKKTVYFELEDDKYFGLTPAAEKGWTFEEYAAKGPESMDKVEVPK